MRTRLQKSLEKTLSRLDAVQLLRGLGVAAVMAVLFYAGTLWQNNRDLKDQLALVSQPGTGATATAALTADIPAVTAADHIRGSLDAQVMIVEYSDLECPYCKQFHPTLENVLSQYGTKVAWVYRHYPLSFHANAKKEAEASECAAEQGGDAAFWKYTDAIYERTTSNGTGFALDKLAPLAQEQGLDAQKLTDCLDSDKYADKVAKQESAGLAAGVNATPTTFLIKKGGTPQPVKGAMPEAQFKAQIDALL